MPKWGDVNAALLVSTETAIKDIKDIYNPAFTRFNAINQKTLVSDEKSIEQNYDELTEIDADLKTIRKKLDTFWTDNLGPVVPVVTIHTPTLEAVKKAAKAEFLNQYNTKFTRTETLTGIGNKWNTYVSKCTKKVFNLKIKPI